MMPDDKHRYTGRFAPSPTGAVHFGTLLAAVASYLQAQVNNGRWLLRMEDVDITRKVAGADSAILNTLETFGFEWDGDVLYQSQQTPHYEQALQQLIEQSQVFPCTCSRKQLAALAEAAGASRYPGICRQRTLPESRPHSLRLRCNDQRICFHDKVMGEQCASLADDCGDFIIKRRDGLFAYQLAVVVDDAMQGITEVVRGADLLDSTPRQIYLQQLLGYPQPDYLHIPLAVDRKQHKFSKSAGAASVNEHPPAHYLVQALAFLGQQPPADLLSCSIKDIWQWALKHWRISNIPRKGSVIVDSDAISSRLQN